MAKRKESDTDREKQRERGRSVVLDTHHFSSKGRWQLLCVIGVGRGVWFAGTGATDRTGENGDDGDAVEALGRKSLL